MSLLETSDFSQSLSQSMPIYHKEYIWNEIRALGKENGPLSSSELSQLDQLHYLGTSAVEHAGQCLEVKDNFHLLDIGSGLGGPARVMASRFNCRVTGIELQEQLFLNSQILTDRCGLSEKVNFIQGDFTQMELSGLFFDGWFSFLSFLHIPNKRDLFSACAQILKPGGTFYIEDYYLRKAASPKEKKLLSEKVGCPYLPTQEEYLKDLQTSGFTGIVFEDMTEVWKNYTLSRLLDFEDHYTQKVQIHSKAVADHLNEFYRTTSQLFEGGNLGGARIYGKIAK